MNIVKTLEKNKADVGEKFEELNQRRQKLQVATTQILEEMACLKGEYRSVEKLLSEFKDTK